MWDHTNARGTKISKHSLKKFKRYVTFESVGNIPALIDNCGIKIIKMITTGHNENELLEQMAAGSEVAFKEIYFLYSGRLYGNILKLVKSRTVAQEILQEVFIKIWEHRATIDTEKSFSSYLFTIARNMVSTFYVKASRDRALLQMLAGGVANGYLHIEEGVISREEQLFLQMAINQLPPQRKQVFELCKIEGKSYHEVSQQLGISLSTISDHIVKANRFLKEYACKNRELIIILALLSLRTGDLLLK
ncbi:RNA polymerase sigma-70 factor (ECF subfamily) [Chitinophaga polysaccharea]|uniref:RNA polymerase sigma factor n=2 Tax=Chitinophaga polysaccharea TaxID=1293035 RepID=A0A561PXS5_9BACT|nr:RNA polymerase sigma-70 factor (ECF subfamily) [Chitinophaga polysaccharea]